MKTFTLAASAACLALLASPSAAANTAGLKRCATIGSPLDRLECYDALARSVDAAPPRAPSPPVSPSVSEAPRPAARPDPAPAPARTAAPAPAPEPVAEAQDFGFEGKRFDETAGEQVARYDGKFLGWSGQTLFKLDNGQVWRQAQSGRVSHRRDRPVIKIKKGAFGSYRLSVEGLNKTIRVKRVK